MNSPILLTKLNIPQIRRNLIDRSRLINQIERCMDVPLTLISAPAGFGKTTLINQWLNNDHHGHGGNFQVGWLSLDDEDDDPNRFWEYFLAAMERNLDEKSCFETAHSLLQGLLEPPIQNLLVQVINTITSRPVHFTLIIDDFQLIHHSSILDGITYLVEHMPENLHLVLLTRADPPLPFGRWRIQGKLNEIRTTDLRFTIDEASKYLQEVQTLNLDSAEIQALEERTEGWIAGLQMAGLSLRDLSPIQADKFISEFSGQNHLILDYLTDEVLIRLSDDLQAFLLKTSILSQFCPSLCAFVCSSESDQTVASGKYSQLLEELDHSNLFVIPLDNQRVWYRYHHLFAELLRVRLNEKYPEWIPLLHRKAAHWYEENGFPFEAMHHAISAQDINLATDVIERTVRKPATWSTGNIARMLEIVNTLPKEVIANRPWLRIYLSGILYVGGQPCLADEMLEDVEKSLVDVNFPSSSVMDELFLYTSTFRGFYAATLGYSVKAVHLAKKVLALLHEDDKRVYGHALATLGQAEFSTGDVTAAARYYSKAVENQKRNNAHFTAVTWTGNLADVLITQGRLHAAVEICNPIIRSTDKDGNPESAVGYLQTFHAAILYEWDQLDEAEEMIFSGLRKMQNFGISPNFGRSHAMLAMVQQAQGKVVDANNSMEIAVQIAQRSGSVRYIDRIAAYQARLWLLQGEVTKAIHWAEGWMELRQELSSSNQLPEYLVENEQISAAWILFAGNRLSDALMIIEPIIASATQYGRLSSLVEGMAVKALILAEQKGNEIAAQQSMLQAVQLSRPEGYIRTYLNLGRSCFDLLKSLTVKDNKIKIYRDLILDHFQSHHKVKPTLYESHQHGDYEKLSSREIEVLNLMASGMTNEQIAQKLYLTNNTIRAHSTHIFDKLGVHNRTEAVTKARALGILR